MDRLDLFTTPLLVFRVPGTQQLNETLTQTMIAESGAEPGLRVSNQGGWHSRPDLSQRAEPVFQGLMQMVVHHVQVAYRSLATSSGANPDHPFRMAITGWAMVMRDGDYTIVHDHASSHFSMAYYPDAGDADVEAHPMSGRLAFVDPRRGAPAIPGADLFPTTFSVQPETGMLVLFPGPVQHYVHAYRGQRPRVSISCNVTLEMAPPEAMGQP